MIPGVDIVSVGEVEKHALAVRLPHAPTFPWLIRESGYSHFAFKLSECYSWEYTVCFIVEIFCLLPISRCFKNYFGFQILVFKLWDSLCKVINFLKSSAFCSFKRIIKFFWYCRGFFMISFYGLILFTLFFFL